MYNAEQGKVMDKKDVCVAMFCSRTLKSRSAVKYRLNEGTGDLYMALEVKSASTKYNVGPIEMSCHNPSTSQKIFPPSFKFKFIEFASDKP